MKAVRFLPTLALLAISSAAIAEQPGTYLVSIAGASAGDNELVEQFTIETWGVEILAICHIPPGWRMRAGTSAAPDGIIQGEATHGVTRLDRKGFFRLRDLALVRISGPVQGGTRRLGSGSEIATFLGHVAIADSRGRHRQVRLTMDNIQLTPETRCPGA